MKVTENEIRPDDIFREYLRLTAADTVTYFKDVERVIIDCPACGTKGQLLFNKVGFAYNECADCKTIYVSPRPVKAAFDKYYTDSPSTQYWATTFYKATETARREKLWKPKAQLIKIIIDKYRDSVPVVNIVDIGGGYGVFDEEISAIMPVRPIVIEPSVYLAEICRKKGFMTIEKFMEDIKPGELPEGRNCFVSFELFEHLHDPAAFMQAMHSVMNKNDLFIFTTLSGIGVDIQVLGEHSRSVSPPHHLNFMNPKSVSLFLGRLGFEVLEAITPGKLDVDIMFKNKDSIKDTFWKNYLEYSSDEERQEMQRFLAGNGLSSHMMITCRKA